MQPERDCSKPNSFPPARERVTPWHRHHSGVGPTDPDEPDTSRQRHATRGLRQVDTELPPWEYVLRGSDYVVRVDSRGAKRPGPTVHPSPGGVHGEVRPVGASAQDQ